MSEKALPVFDVPQLFVASFVWTIPGQTGNRFANAVLTGWTLFGITNYHSGLPFMVFLTTDNENIGTVSGRSTEFPNLVGNPYAVQKSVQEWFNTAAFGVPAPYTIGNVGRNILRTDTLISTDMSISKQPQNDSSGSTRCKRNLAAFGCRGRSSNRQDLVG